ncbi:hypothetical protein K7640_08075 [Micromonospora sp. PLK6-60]|uniref:hypothetical protein n=1 Tax=Micromonospora sp. PLK6-60 TaxID=2873383 RepID=UPI001CA64C6B|nr:hypothetical protein [Micromonospora sp. PLK6-60]MBY8871796.1 hypothetical protein [Micromonospora sp. PLK6-60]
MAVEVADRVTLGLAVGLPVAAADPVAAAVPDGVGVRVTDGVPVGAAAELLGVAEAAGGDGVSCLSTGTSSTAGRDVPAAAGSAASGARPSPREKISAQIIDVSPSPQTVISQIGRPSADGVVDLSATIAGLLEDQLPDSRTLYPPSIDGRPTPPPRGQQPRRAAAPAGSSPGGQQ